MPDLSKGNPDGTAELTDEEIQQLMALGIIPDQQNALSQQMATADQLRYHNSPQMREGSRVTTAANPLEFVASTVQGIKAGKELEALKKRQDELLQKQVDGRSLYYKSLRPRTMPQDPHAVEDAI